MSSVTFIEGRAGSGKTTKMLKCATALIEQGERVLILVPDQFTFATERMLADTLGHGLLESAVYSFTSLADRVLELSGDHVEYLSTQGKRMVIRKVIDENKSKLSAFGAISDTNGFAKKCDEMFSRFKRCLITPAMLTEAAKHDNAPTVLKRKLADLAILYDATEEYLKNRYMDSEDMLNSLIEHLPDSFVRGAHIFMDGFLSLTEQKYKIIEKLIAIAATVTVTVCLDDVCSDRELFEPRRRSKSRVVHMAQEAGAPISVVHCHRTGAEGFAPELSHMERELFAFPFSAYDDSEVNITVFAAQNMRNECEALCNEIIGAVHEGERYRDMSVLVCNPEAYSGTLQNTMKRYGIPFFMDVTRPLTEHPLAQLIIASLRCITQGYARSDMLGIMRSGFIKVSKEQAESFENHLLKYNISGSQFHEDFAQEDAPKGTNELRAAIIKPLTDFQAALARANTVGRKIEVLYAYLEGLEAMERMNDMTDELRANDRLQQADETAQAWSTTMDLFTQLYAIMHDVRVSNKRFLDILEEGFSCYRIGVIPTTVDQLLVGNTERTCAEHMNRLFVVGASADSLPARARDDDMLDDRELAFLQSLGMSTWESSTERASINTFGVYNALCKAKKSIYFSYDLGDSNTPESALIDRLIELFPGLHKKNDTLSDLVPHHMQMARLLLMRGLRQYADTGKLCDNTARLLSWFSSNQTSEIDMEHIRHLLFFSPSEDSLDPDVVEALYPPNTVASASRLESFNRCPFSYLLQYGLRLKERDILKERPVDSGSFYHEVMDRFFSLLAEKDMNFAEMTREQCDELINPILEEISSKHNNGIFASSAKYGLMKLDMFDVARDTAWAAVKQIACGSFRPYKTEIKFGEDGDYPPFELKLDDGTRFLFSGAIDRLDTYEDRGRIYIRVIDYKSGGKTFTFDDLYSGIHLQLPLYALAMLGTDSAMQAAGVYYMPLITPQLDESAFKKSTPAEKTLLGQFAFNGITLNDEGIIAANDSSENGKSIVTGIGPRTSDNRLLNSEEMDLFLRFAEKKATDTLRKILHGYVKAEPVKGESSRGDSCTYCQYKGICMFDVQFRGCKFKSSAKISKEEFLDIARGTDDK